MRYDWNYVTLVRQLIEVTPAQLRVWIRLILLQKYFIVNTFLMINFGKLHLENIAYNPTNLSLKIR